MNRPGSRSAAAAQWNEVTPRHRVTGDRADDRAQRARNILRARAEDRCVSVADLLASVATAGASGAGGQSAAVEASSGGQISLPENRSEVPYRKKSGNPGLSGTSAF